MKTLEQALRSLGYVPLEFCSACAKKVNGDDVVDRREIGWPQQGLSDSEYPAKLKILDVDYIVCSPACALELGRRHGEAIMKARGP